MIVAGSMTVRISGASFKALLRLASLCIDAVNPIEIHLAMDSTELWGERLSLTLFFASKEDADDAASTIANVKQQWANKL